MDFAFARRQTAFAAAAEMIVVRADHDEFVFQNGIGAVDDADDIGSFYFAVHHIDG